MSDARRKIALACALVIRRKVSLLMVMMWSPTWIRPSLATALPADTDLTTQPLIPLSVESTVRPEVCVCVCVG